MRKAHRRILLTGITLEFIATLVPQWTRTELQTVGDRQVLVTQSAGFFPLFQPPTVGIGQSIDFGRQIIMWLLIALACAFAWAWVSKPAPAQSE